MSDLPSRELQIYVTTLYGGLLVATNTTHADAPSFLYPEDGHVDRDSPEWQDLEERFAAYAKTLHDRCAAQPLDEIFRMEGWAEVGKIVLIWASRYGRRVNPVGVAKWVATTQSPPEGAIVAPNASGEGFIATNRSTPSTGRFIAPA